MEENKKRVNVAVIFLILAIIVILVMGYYIYTLLNTQKEQNDKIEELNSTDISLQDKKEENVFNNNEIIIDGTYVNEFPSGEIYYFYKDGKIIWGTELEEREGTYKINANMDFEEDKITGDSSTKQTSKKRKIAPKKILNGS